MPNADGYQLELLKWGNGEVRLTYWDSIHGQDKSFILCAGNSRSDSPIAYLEDERGRLRQINLVRELLKMLGLGGGVAEICSSCNGSGLAICPKPFIGTTWFVSCSGCNGEKVQLGQKDDQKDDIEDESKK